MRRLARPLMYVGVVAVVMGLGKYHASTRGGYDFTSSFRFSWSFAYIALLCVAAYASGLPDVPRSARSRLPAALLASAAGALGMSAVQLFVGDALLPRFVVFGAAAVLVPWYYAMSALAGAGRSAQERRDRVVVVGPAELEADLTAELQAHPERPAVVVGHLAEAEAVGGDQGSRPLIEAASELAATVLVLSGPAQTDERVVDQAALLHETGVRVRTRSLFYEEWLGKIPVADLGRVSLFFDIGEIHRMRYSRFKRLVDLVLCVPGMLALAIALPIVWAANLFGNRGPLFYRQLRVGRGGVVFMILKFRSMRPDHDASTGWTAQGDPRVTPFGRFLRSSHLDELPQIWNIAKGDLSVVGPRPEQPQYVAELVDKLPFYDLRHIVRPGLTGWAQVKYGYAGDERDALEKLQYDFHYLRRQSVSFDLRIIGRSLRSVVGGLGRGR